MVGLSYYWSLATDTDPTQSYVKLHLCIGTALIFDQFNYISRSCVTVHLIKLPICVQVCPFVQLCRLVPLCQRL